MAGSRLEGHWNAPNEDKLFNKKDKFEILGRISEHIIDVFPYERLGVKWLAILPSL
jgi:hypothetical protein